MSSRYSNRLRFNRVIITLNCHDFLNHRELAMSRLECLQQHKERQIADLGFCAEGHTREALVKVNEV